MPNNTVLSIIIVNYNSKGYLKQCIESIKTQTKNILFEILIIDNNSLEKLDNFNEKNYPNCKFIYNQFNVGFGVASNSGIRITSSKYILLLNPDTVLLNDVISIFYDFMEKKENQLVWCVGAQLLDEAGNPAKSYGRFPNLIDVISEQFGIKGILLKIFGKKYLRKRNFVNENKEIPFVTGCNMFMKRQALEKIRLFNEKFFLNYEETELSWRAKQYGLKSVILPEAKILHHSRKSFTNLQSYLNHLWLGQLLFFKLAHNRIVFLIVKVFHLTGAILRFIFKLDKEYLTHAKKLLSI